MSKEAKILSVKRRELFFSVGRRMVVPGCICYGLFLVRPTEPNFVNYISQTRRIDKSFNDLFPPTDAKTVPELCEDTRKYRTEGGSVQVTFRDIIIGAHGKVSLVAPNGEKHNLHFLGACGALWWRAF